jgi:hypothetical protein
MPAGFTGVFRLDVLRLLKLSRDLLPASEEVLPTFVLRAAPRRVGGLVHHAHAHELFGAVADELTERFGTSTGASNAFEPPPATTAVSRAARPDGGKRKTPSSSCASGARVLVDAPATPATLVGMPDPDKVERAPKCDERGPRHA